MLRAPYLVTTLLENLHGIALLIHLSSTSFIGLALFLFFSVLSYSKMTMFLDVSGRVPHFQAVPWNYFATC